MEDSPRAMVVWTKLASIQMCGHCCRRQLPPTPPGALAPSPDHGWALCPPGPCDPSTAITCRCAGCPAPWLPPPAAIPEQNRAGEGALRGAERARHPPSPSRPPPPRPVTSGPSGPAPGRPGTNPQRVQYFGRRGDGQGPRKGGGGPRKRQQLERERGSNWPVLHPYTQSPRPLSSCL